MPAGVSLESVSADATFAEVSGTWDADYPVTNLADLYRPSQVARVASGASSFTATFAAASVGVVALVNHTLAAADTVRVQAGGYDSGTVAVGALASGYRATRPFVFPTEEAGVTTVTITLGAAGAVEIGAVEIARFWQWRGISPGAEVGFRDTNKDIDLIGGARLPQGGRRPRTYNGQMDRLALSIAESRGLDFQKIKGRAVPFVFCEDTTEWARGCFLARNMELPPSVGAVYRHDTWQFRFVEHFR